MDPATFALVAQGVSGVAGGVAAYSSAKGQKEQAERNAYVGRTRALQTDVSARQGLESELATMRSVMGVNGQKQNVGTAAISDELRNTRGRERRIEFGNRNTEAADFRTQAANAGSAARSGLLGGLLKAGPSLFDLYQLRKK